MTAAAWADVDLSAVRFNVGALVDMAAGADVIAVVKADAYGHGMIPCARAARDAGASAIGVAFVSEALTLRHAGDSGRLIAWLHPADCDFTDAVAVDIELSVSSLAHLDSVLKATERAGRPARVHLKIDTGMHRGGATPSEWGALVNAAVRAQHDKRVSVVGLWSHLSHSDEPHHESTDAQVAAFDSACAVAFAQGIREAQRHIANSGAVLTRPDLAFDAVRPGLAIYGLSPSSQVGTPASLGLRPAMTLRSSVALVKSVSAGSGVSYSHRYVTAATTDLALIPLGYADGIPRSATNRGPVRVQGRTLTISGAVSMDQIVVDVGADSRVQVGDPVVVFGPGDSGEPTVADWALACDTITYEIVTRLGPRVARVHHDGPLA